MLTDLLNVFFFFFKQKTAYEIMPSLVGSEMCIRDRVPSSQVRAFSGSTLPLCTALPIWYHSPRNIKARWAWTTSCLLYTSDAADDLLCVDLGGRRIIKKKKQYENGGTIESKNKRKDRRNERLTVKIS